MAAAPAWRRQRGVARLAHVMHVDVSSQTSPVSLSDSSRTVGAMATRDLDKTASRFLSALRRTGSGLETQRQRIVDRAANAPRLLPGSRIEVIDLTGDKGNDLDYYIFELARLQDIGKALTTVFGRVLGVQQGLLDAQAAFEAAIPRLREIRNPLTHPNDDDKLDQVGWFSSVVSTEPDGRVSDLVDPRYGHHGAAMAYHAALTAYLRAHVTASIESDPPRTPGTYDPQG